MTNLQLLAILLVLPGAAFLLASGLLTLKVAKEVPAPFLNRWRMLTALIFFFLAGYLLFLVIQFSPLTLPAEAVTSAVFFGGAVFVLLVITLARTTIRQVTEAEQHLEHLNLSLRAKNEELKQEVAARALAEKQARHRLQQLSTLHAIDLVITSNLDLKATMKLFLEQVVPQLEVDAGAVLILNPHLQELEYLTGIGFRTTAIERSWERVGEGTAGMVAKEREIIVHPTFATCPGMKRRGLTSEEEGFVSYFAAPLISQGEVKGVLELFRRSPFDPDREWLEFFEALAVQASIAVDNATLFRNLQDKNAELILAYDTTIEGWARALELRDAETEGHTQRATETTLKVAKHLGFREEHLVHVRRGALLHDIGKMAVPDAILMKSGPLTEEEQEIMHRHPQYAFDLLYPIAYLRPAIDIPYCHHEWWDGSGYPRGLKGEQIPLPARIFAIADTWDALVSSRRYHPAWPREKAEAHIRSLAGVQFDPDLVETFFEVMNEDPGRSAPRQQPSPGGGKSGAAA